MRALRVWGDIEIGIIAEIGSPDLFHLLVYLVDIGATLTTHCDQLLA